MSSHSSINLPNYMHHIPILVYQATWHHFPVQYLSAKSYGMAFQYLSSKLPGIIICLLTKLYGNISLVPIYWSMCCHICYLSTKLHSFTSLVPITWSTQYDIPGISLLNYMALHPCCLLPNYMLSLCQKTIILIVTIVKTWNFVIWYIHKHLH
jgi:hypothetical protein